MKTTNEIDRNFPIYEAILDENFCYVPGKELDWPETIWAIYPSNYTHISPAFNLFDICITPEDSIRVLANAKVSQI